MQGVNRHHQIPRSDGRDEYLRDAHSETPIREYRRPVASTKELYRDSSLASSGHLSHPHPTGSFMLKGPDTAIW